MDESEPIHRRMVEADSRMAAALTRMKAALDRARAADQRGQAAVGRQQASQRRGSAAAAREKDGSEPADERDRLADVRDAAADERDRLADARDAAEDEREQAGDRREAAADERERLADEREVTDEWTGWRVGHRDGDRRHRMDEHFARQRALYRDGEKLRADSAALAEQLADTAEVVATIFEELAAGRGDAERRLKLAQTEREVASIARRNAARLREPHMGSLGLEHIPDLPGRPAPAENSDTGSAG